MEVIDSRYHEQSSLVEKPRFSSRAPRQSVWINKGNNYHVPVNKRRWTNAGLMLGQRRRRWPNIKPTLVDVFCLLGWHNLCDPLNPTAVIDMQEMVLVPHRWWLDIQKHISPTYVLHCFNMFNFWHTAMWYTLFIWLLVCHTTSFNKLTEHKISRIIDDSFTLLAINL